MASKSDQGPPPRTRSFENCEERLVLSANPLGDIFLDPMVIEQVETADFAPPELLPSLAAAHESSGAAYVDSAYGFNGSRQTVAVIDSGIAWNHTSLGKGFGEDYRVVGGWDFAENDANPYDDGPAGFHGTHVAGIIGSDHATNRGVADGVDLVALRVFDDQGAGNFAWVEQALQWVHDHRNDFENPITTVNLSLGTSWNSNNVPNWAMLENEFAQLKADGIFISVAAGNSYTSYNQAGLSYPAASPYVVPVAALSDSDTLASFSQRNSRVIAAPGVSIISTVPDHVGNYNGKADDFRSLSGTSMAAPYVAGASVIVREAMEFVGRTDITQDTIYNHMRATGDQFYDSATKQYYTSLNLQQAIDSLMPEDDFGSTVGSAWNLGSLSGSNTIDGLIGKLDDQDYFTFTAGASGQMSFSVDTTHNLSGAWQNTVSGATTSGGVLSFAVTAGQSYTVGLGTGAGIGYYQINATLEASTPPATDLGTVEFAEYSSQPLALNGSWYQVTAARDGVLSAIAMNGTQGNVALEIYNGQSIISGSAATRQDVTVTAGQTLLIRATGNAGGEFTLCVANLVQQQGNTVTIYGTEADNQFTFAAGATHTLSLDGLQYSFAASSASRFVFAGAGGNDQVTLTGTTGNELAVLSAGQVDLTGNGFSVSASNAERIVVHGGGGSDTAILNGTDGNDVLVAGPQSVTLTGQGLDLQVDNFANVTANGGAGEDTARLNDSAGNDTLTIRVGSAVISGAGYTNRANGFEHVVAVATTGNDTATLYDTAGDDVLVQTPTTSHITGAGYYAEATGFDRVDAIASTGNDTASLFDSAGADSLTMAANWGYMQGDGYYNYYRGFDSVYGYATAGGADKVFVWDTAGNDSFTLAPKWGYAQGNGYYNYFRGFANAYAYATAGGNDTAFLWDSAGDDTFIGQQAWSGLTGSYYSNMAKGFDQVYAYATAGGNDTARLFDSAGEDVFTSTPTWSSMTGAGTMNQARGFDQVTGYSSGGNDQAIFRDSAGNDTFTARPSSAQMTGAGFNNTAVGFASVAAYATSGNDLATLYDSKSDDQLVMTAKYSRMTGDNYSALAQGFDRVDAVANAGGNNSVSLYDSAGSDSLTMASRWGYMQGDGFYNYYRGFDRAYAYASGGGGDKVFLWDNAGDDSLTMAAGWGYMQGTGYYNYYRGFYQAYAYAVAGGNDQAFLWDTPGNDRFVGQQDWAQLSGVYYSSTVRGFDKVTAYAMAGGNDTALLYDSAGTDEFTSTSSWSRLSGNSFMNVARGFGTVAGYSINGGSDRAFLFDSAGNDVFTAGKAWSRMQGAGYQNTATGFANTTGYASTGVDQAIFSAVGNGETFYGREQLAVLNSLQFEQRAVGFDKVTAQAATGESASADIAALDFAFEQLGDWQ